MKDPKIHTKNGFIINDDENLGDEGIAQFFNELHPECNMICRSLSMKRPIWDENFEKQKDFLHMKKYDIEKLTILCDFCYKFKKIPWTVFEDVTLKNHPLLPCTECDVLLNEKTQVKCSCGKPFNFSKMLHDRCKINYPAFCFECKEVVS